MRSKKETTPMLKRRTIGISLAFLMVSAGAMAKPPEKAAYHHPSQSHGAKAQHAKHRHASSSKLAHGRAHARYAAYHSAPRSHRYSAASADEGGGAADPYFASAQSLGARQIGMAAWYNLLGCRTSNGEILDTVTATAAHRTLALGSFAKVTSLETGRSVIVRINDRGPHVRRFIIDLSPKAADELDMRRNGVASVVIEPISGSIMAASPTVTRFESTGAPVTR
jgi:rare lipoprotein A (peptidoglycan hydrolase)